MEESSVTFKGTVNGLTIIMEEESDFDTIYNQIEKKISSAGRFFKDASIIVKYRGRNLSEKEKNLILKLMTSKSGANIIGIEEDTEEVPKLDDKALLQKPRKIRMSNYYFKGLNEGMTKIYRGTVRSGQLINYDGNLVIVGDVNPGGEVVATGSILVMGSLRGIVHAGADGNKDAMVVAFNLQPTQLRIADVITHSPDDKEVRSQMIPELAYVKDGMVYIERYLPQYK